MRLSKRILNHPAAISALCWLGAKYLRLVWLTGRWEWHNFETPQKMIEDGKPLIGCFWHNRLLMQPFLWRYAACKGIKRPFHMLISSHRDGVYISKAVRHLGITTIQGSTTRGGAKALMGILRTLKNGGRIGITPDGPRGPRMHAQRGAIEIARLSGAPLFAVAYSTTRRKVFKSWDQFIFPLPFARGVMVCSDPIHVDRHLDDKGFEAARSELERRLNEVAAEVDRRTGFEPIRPATQAEIAKRKTKAGKKRRAAV